jgi:serine/threonine protein kinase/Flp pilus assembly protein TadD
MTSKTISHYRIIEKLGEGGMGVVYKAEDTRLRRKVVLKFLHPHLTTDKGTTRRFEREAQAAAALNHPNIITIHEIGEYKEQTFIVMEYVEGISLRDTLSKEPMPIDKAAMVARQVCEGLSKAHNAGIIHRDIKPENILIERDGHVKIVDFGLARMRGVSKLTRDASVMGTLKYMSPEQFQNKKVDHRSDIWSFGVVLFEMITGQLPFKGDYEAAVMYSVLNEEPQSVPTVRKNVPDYLIQIIMKAMEKEPARRWKSFQDILQALKETAIHSTAVQEQEKSILVLPFVNMSPDPEQEYFSDGLTEEIIADLSHIQDLRVISRTSAMRLKNTDKDMKTISRELGVRYVLEGSVRKAANSLRITAQLIDAAADTHLWADKYSGTLNDVFDIQEKVSRSIADALRLNLSPEEDRHIAARPINDLVAYECYLRAKRQMVRWTVESTDNAIELLERALRTEGPNELIYATLGQAYLVYLCPIPLKEAESMLAKAESYAAKVFELNPESPEGHELKGEILFHKGETKDALMHLKKTCQLTPQNSSAWLWITGICGISGKMEAARFYYNKLTAIEPWSGMNPNWIDFYSGNFEIAADGYRKEYEMDPESPYTRWAYGCVLAWAGRTDNAYEILEKILRDTPDFIYGQFASFLLNALRERTEEALRAFTPEVLSWAKDQWQMPWMLASLYSLAGKTDESLYWLELAVNRGFINYPFLAEKEPFLERIRGEERFKKLMKRVKKEWENFEV